jgi:hypothetical protein
MTRTSVEAAIDRYCEAWSVDDPDRRATLLASVWADGAVYSDPTVHVVGAPALLDHIAAVLARRPGARVLRTSALDHHHDVARFAWAVLAADGAILRDGIDVAIIDASGRIVRMIGFFGPPSAQ